ncbi:hypothetical protein KCU85_g8196, partial [Aureobasidium melanogenum]
MTLASLKRHLSRALAHHDVEASGADSASPKKIAKADKQLQHDRQSSTKASIYQHSPTHSGHTLHNPEHASTDLSADVMVHVMTVGDSIITIESQREDDQVEQPAAKRRRRTLGFRRVKTAPAASRTVPLHGSVTTIESVSKSNRLRAWSYPLSNFKDNLIRRMRRGTEPKEARNEIRRGKISCELNSERQSSADVDGAQSPSQEPYFLMSGAYQGSLSHVNLATDEMAISPRTSIDLGNRPPARMRPDGSPTNPATELSSRNGDQDKRKDSHFHGVLQIKEQTSAEMEGNTRELTPDEHQRKSSIFLLRPIYWIRQHYASSPVRSLSASSSSSDSPLSSPVMPPACPPRRIQEMYTSQAHPAISRLFKASSCDELYSGSQLHLPPGFEIPAEGQAGPVDWVHRGWEEHYRRSAESAHRACHSLTAARSLPARNEVLQRYNVVSACHGSQCVQTQRVQSIPYSTEHISQAWDFAVDGKGKGRRCVEDVGAEDWRGRVGQNTGAGHQRQRRRRSKGACVTTVTLGECNFAKELEQGAEQGVA